jgi:D-arabinose 1-dehydrogenase-like Zn-dependent alcohol dehydrogenase
VDVYFDQPVDTDQIASRVFLRNSAGKQMKTHVTVSPSEIPDYTTHLLVETLDLLPFNQKLSLAVGTEFKDLAGIALEKPYFAATDLIFKELDIRGSFIYQQEFAQAIELLNRGAVDVESLTSDVRPVAAAEAAFGEMRQPDKAIKILLRA